MKSKSKDCPNKVGSSTPLDTGPLCLKKRKKYTLWINTFRMKNCSNIFLERISSTTSKKLRKVGRLKSTLRTKTYMRHKKNNLSASRKRTPNSYLPASRPKANTNRFLLKKKRRERTGISILKGGKKKCYNVG